MDFVKAFVCGGLICVLTQILMEKTKLMPGRIMVILVTTGVVLGAVGIYAPFVKFAGIFRIVYRWIYFMCSRSISSTYIWIYCITYI